MKTVKTKPGVLRYLPDADDKGEIHVDRAFLFAILNSQDPEFFPQALKRIENERQEALQKKEED